MKKELLSKLKKKMPEQTGMPEMEISLEGPESEGPEGEMPEAEGPELEISMGPEGEGMEGEGEGEGEASMSEMDLSGLSDDELLAEIKKRGLKA